MPNGDKARKEAHRQAQARAVKRLDKIADRLDRVAFTNVEGDPEARRAYNSLVSEFNRIVREHDLGEQHPVKRLAKGPKTVARGGIKQRAASRRKGRKKSVSPNIVRS